MRIQANETKLTRYKVLVMDCLVGSSGQKIYFLKKYLSQVSTFWIKFEFWKELNKMSFLLQSFILYYKYISA